MAHKTFLKFVDLSSDEEPLPQTENNTGNNSRIMSEEDLQELDSTIACKRKHSR